MTGRGASPRGSMQPVGDEPRLSATRPRRRRWPRRTSPSPVDLLVASPLFDPAWWTVESGLQGTPHQLARDYLERPSVDERAPHPLFVPRMVARHLSSADDPRGRDPLVAYLQDRAFDVPTHPLFDLPAYLEQV